MSVPFGMSSPEVHAPKVEALFSGEGITVPCGSPVEIWVGQKHLQITGTRDNPILTEPLPNGASIGLRDGEYIFIGRGQNPNEAYLTFPLITGGKDYETVSRWHAYIWKDGSNIHVWNLSSTNGTKVIAPEGTPVTRWKKEIAPPESEKPKKETVLFSSYMEMGGRSEQEDLIEKYDTPYGPLFVVMDGHSGGYPRTQQAIREALGYSFTMVARDQWNNPSEALQRMYAEIDQYLQNHYGEVGTTVTMAHYNPSKKEVTVANIGDTRSYLVTGDGRQCREAVSPLTMDQARPYIVGNGGYITPDGRVARLGRPYDDGINVPDTLGDPGFPTLKTPRMASYTVNGGEIFLVMGTDGFWGSEDCRFVTEEDLRKTVRSSRKGPDLERLKQELAEIAHKTMDKVAPGYRDNASLFVACIKA